MEYFFIGMVFVFGTIVGSFLNVVVLRYGFSEAPRHRSGCSACEKSLKWYELVPVVSYIVLQGRCLGCGSKLSLQYPVVELLTGAVFAASFLMLYPFVTIFNFLTFVAFLVFWASFTVLTTYDIKHTLIPMSFSLVLIFSAFTVRVFEALSLSSMVPLYDAGLGALIFGGFLFFLYVITRGKGMGLGDSYVAIALGLLFGVMQTFDVILISFWTGAVVGIVLLVLKKGFKMKSEVPFVPFLFVGALVGAFTAFSPLVLISTLIYGI